MWETKNEKKTLISNLLRLNWELEIKSRRFFDIKKTEKMSKYLKTDN
jgi:hypothetical protein